MKIVLSSSCSEAVNVYNGLYRERGIDNPNFPDYLMSYWYCFKANGQDNPRALQPFANSGYSGLFLDSGVFSARKQGVIIPWERLCDFYHTQAHTVRYVFSMDSGEYADQLRKARQMAARGVPVVPIYHAGMPLHYINEFREFSDFIALGMFEAGSASKDTGQRYLDTVFGHLHRQNLWPTKVHILGCESIKILSRYPFYSSDASTFYTEAAFVQLKQWDDVRHKLIPLDREIVRVQYPHYNDRFNYAVRQREHMQRYLTQLWRSRGIVWED